MSQLVLDRILPVMSSPAAPTEAVPSVALPPAGAPSPAAASTSLAAPTPAAPTSPSAPSAAVPSTPGAPAALATRAPASPDPRPRPSVEVAGPDTGRTAAGDPVAFRPTSAVALALAAARADAVHLAFSAQVPTVEAMTRVVAQLETEIAAVGRDRASVRVVLDVDVVPAPDAEVARRKRSLLDHLDALAGLTWSPSATRVVATPTDAVVAAAGLAQRVGVDGVVLVPLAEGQAADELRTLVAATR